jgi:putative heme iron utilization protein
MTETARRNPLQPADAAAVQQARDLIRAARHAALAYTDPDTGTPGISRIAFGPGPSGGAVTLISSLAPHFAALKAWPDCAVMVGEPGAKGDPLTHPRLMLRAVARFVPHDDPDRPALRAHWLRDHPKSALYIDFADFAFVTLAVTQALLNGGFGRAHLVPPETL